MTIFFTATQENAETNLRRLSEVVLKFENPDFSGSASFASFDDLLDEIGKQRKSSKSFL